MIPTLSGSDAREREEHAATLAGEVEARIPANGRTAGAALSKLEARSTLLLAGHAHALVSCLQTASLINDQNAFFLSASCPCLPGRRRLVVLEQGMKFVRLNDDVTPQGFRGGVGIAFLERLQNAGVLAH